ncbi:hypothetical protein [Enterococcus mundtii]|uniref:hypothetical protein n=1 Tax=Enterococcus mundtii TaxID=53346 RepID=UPI0035C6CBA5
MRKNLNEDSRNPSIIWEGHFAGIEKYCHIEKLTSLDQLPSTGFKLSCFPTKIKKRRVLVGSRMVAVMEENQC